MLEFDFQEASRKKRSVDPVWKLPCERDLKNLKQGFPNDKSKCSRKTKQLDLLWKDCKFHPCYRQSGLGCQWHDWGKGLLKISKHLWSCALNSSSFWALKRYCNDALKLYNSLSFSNYPGMSKHKWGGLKEFPWYTCKSIEFTGNLINLCDSQQKLYNPRLQLMGCMKLW